MPITTCRLCGDSQTKLAIRDHYEFKGHTIVACATCGAMFTDPPLTEEDLSTFYLEEYDLMRTNRPDLGRLSHTIQRALAQKEYVLTHSGLAMDTSTRILDIGCNVGSLLSAFRPITRHLYGLEPGAELGAIAVRRGVTVLGSFFPAIPAPMTFDLMTASHVLEHVSDPDTFLQAIRAHLAPDGRLFIEVPHESPDFIRATLGNGAHTYFFTSDSLSRHLLRNSYRIVHLTTSEVRREDAIIQGRALRQQFDHDPWQHMAPRGPLKLQIAWWMPVRLIASLLTFLFLFIFRSRERTRLYRRNVAPDSEDCGTVLRVIAKLES